MNTARFLKLFGHFTALCMKGLIQIARPNTILFPLLLAVVSEIHHKCESELVVTPCFRVWFQDHEGAEFGRSWYCHGSSSQISNLHEISDIPLYPADNPDILQSTINGRNTLLMMEIVQSVVRTGSFT